MKFWSVLLRRESTLHRKHEEIDLSLAAPFFSSLIGKPVSHVWQGAGSAIFIEFGKLHGQRKLNGEPGNPTGDVTLMIEWSWRIERARSILGGSWTSERRWEKMFEKLIGETVVDVECFGTLPEICLSLGNGMRVLSFMTASGQPQWAILTRHPSMGSLSVKGGKLFVGK
ncbi:hypothetical protein PQR63_01315 [Herbaspirillum rhizosphaerae]|uniref:Uncharacterized protein n=1 Tax=Herbaspirillum rhizosphaerae TaxID=346179 RepID=A0ABW8Z3V0_9BURK